MQAQHSARRAPRYTLHKASGQAIVRLNGKQVYLGKFASPESRTKYDQVIAEWLARGRRATAGPSHEFLVLQMIHAFREHAKRYYRRPDGSSSSERAVFDSALRPLNKLYGESPAADFSVLKLKAVREKMIDEKWSRKSINSQINRLRHVFKWAASMELVSPAVLESLKTLPSLKAGRSEAIESEPVKPVLVEFVHAIIPYVSPQVATLMQLQLLTAARAGELVMMRGADLETTGKVWIYRPLHHKSQHHGDDHRREIYLGPQAQEVVRPFLKSDLKDYLFDPREAEEHRRQQQEDRRKTPLGYGNGRGKNRVASPDWAPGPHYTTSTYRQAIRRGCDAADLWAKGGLIIGNDDRAVPAFTPHQLRHTAATQLRKRWGIEGAQVMLGHRHLNVTEIYAERNFEAAQKIAAER